MRIIRMLSVAIVFVLAYSNAMASGFGVFTQGASGLGQANAVVAHTTGPSSAYFNPALLTQVFGTQVEIGTTGVYAKHKVDLKSGGTQHGEENWEFPSTFYLTHNINEKLTAGLAVYYPFGLSSEWNDKTFEGRYIGTYGEITTTSINPVLAYKVNDRLAIAAGVSAVYFDAELRQMINQAALFGYALPGVPDIEQKFTGDDWGFGYNLGASFNVNKNVSLGIAYRSKVELEVDGKVEFSGVTQILENSFENLNGKTDVTLPQQAVAGVACRFNDSLIGEVGVRWEDWESTNELRFVFDNGTSSVIPRNWHSTWTYNVGGQYRASDNLSLNAGYLYGKNAVPDETFEVMIPDSDAHLFTLGAEWHQERWTIAGAFGYEYHEGRTKHNNVADQYGTLANLGTPVNTANGKYDSSVYLVGVSLTKKF